MELAIPLVALGGMYVIANQNKNNSKEGFNKDEPKTANKKLNKENFDNMGIRTNLQANTYLNQGLTIILPNTHVAPQNYPIMNNKELVDTVQEYPQPKCSDRQVFQSKCVRTKGTCRGKKIGDNIQQVYSLSR